MHKYMHVSEKCADEVDVHPFIGWKCGYNKEGEVSKTEIVYVANLNFERASRILKWLMEKGWVESNTDTHQITERGEEILKGIDKLAALFK